MDIHLNIENKDSDIIHWNNDKAIYHVIICLADAIPLLKKRRWQTDRVRILHKVEQENRPLTKREEKKISCFFTEKMDDLLDQGLGDCLLADPIVALVIRDTLHYEQMTHPYRLHAWCIMPNHVHVVVEPDDESHLARIIRAWKRFSTDRANCLLNRTERLWLEDHHEQVISSRKEYMRITHHLWRSPVEARQESAPRWIGREIEPWEPR